MSTPTAITAALQSQMPALCMLQKLGYQLLSAEQVAVERQGRLDRVLLEGILHEQLHRLNRIHYKGQTLPFSDENIRRAMETLRDVPFEGVVRSSERVYDLLTLGKSFEQSVEGEQKGFTLRYIDWHQPQNNVYHATAHFRVEAAPSRRVVEVDIVAFVNGVPFIAIQCAPETLDQAVKQHLCYQSEGQIPQLYFYTQILFALTSADAVYATTGTPRSFWAHWHELTDAAPLVQQLVNTPLPAEQQAQLFTGIWSYARAELEPVLQHPYVVTAQDSLLHAMARPQRLMELAHQFIIYDEGGGVKKIARYQQYFAVKRTLERVHQRCPDGRRRGGVIWHTQGSGKSLLMVLLGKALALDEQIPNARIILVTDRVDLDEQIWKTFHLCGKDPQQAKTGRHLQELLLDPTASVITTVLDKFRAAANSKGYKRLEDENVFVLIDEAHRSQYGEANLKMQRTLPRACYISFTGTPLMRAEKNTAEKFGGFIEPSYTIQDALADGAVVPLLYEGRHLVQRLEPAELEALCQQLTAKLSPAERAELLTCMRQHQPRLSRLESVIKLIALDVSNHFSSHWQGTGFKGQLTAPGKREALLLKQHLDAYGKVSSEVLISAPDEIENAPEHEQPESDASITTFWRKMMRRYGSEREYNRQLIHAFKQQDQPEILIVVDKLLTGFDAPRNTVLYIARSLREHHLLQAIARVNRLYPGKDYGYIIDYYGIITQLHEALELYESLGGHFDAADLSSAMTCLAQDVRDLARQHDALWQLFHQVVNKQDEEALADALVDAAQRQLFYQLLSTFSRMLKRAHSSSRWLRETPAEQIQRYRADMALFHHLRANLKQYYGEKIDHQEYEPQIQKFLHEHLQIQRIEPLLEEPVDIFQRELFQRQLQRAKTPRSAAQMIANRIQATLSVRLDEDPFFYRQFAEDLQRVVSDYQAHRLQETHYLEAVTDLMHRIRDGRTESAPAVLVGRDFSRALFGAFKEKLSASLSPVLEWMKPEPASIGLNEPPAPSLPVPLQPPTPLTDPVLAELALEVEAIIRCHATVNWRENTDAQNRMRNEMEDALHRLVISGRGTLNYSQMDALMDAAIMAAINRPSDV
jgi:type I restriction enzyme, R subunit